MIKKNLLGIVIVTLIAGAFVAGYLVGKRSAPKMPSDMAQRMATMGGQPPGGQPPGGQQPPGEQPGNAAQQQPGQRSGEQNSPQQQPEQRSAGQNADRQPGQEREAMTPDANPGGGSSGVGGQFGGGQGMTEEMRAVIMKAREEGKSREEIQALIVQLREQAGADQSQQPEAGQPYGQPGDSDTQPPAQRQRPGGDATASQQQRPAATPAPNMYEFYGTAAPSAEVNVQSKQGGTITFLKGKEGDSVEKGEVLVRFDASEQQLNLEKARSSRNATLQQVQQAESNVKAAQTNVQRNQQLFNEGLVSQQQMDDLLNKLESAKSSLTGANENVKQADTQIALLEKGLENFVVHAPIGGIIDKKNYNLQEIYRANDVLYHVVNIDKVYINVDVPETYIKQIREGMSVSVSFNALGEQRFPGTVETVLPSGTTANRTFTVRVLVDNPDHAIQPGMFASVEMVFD